MKWQQQYDQRQKELYLQLQQQHKNLLSRTTPLDLQLSLTTSSSSSPKPATMISSPDSAYDDNIGSDKRVNDVTIMKSQSTFMSSSSNNNNTTTLKKKTPPKKKSRKNNMKPKDTRRHTSISFDEMCRLMRVYGSLKCLRNRTTKTTTNKNNNVVDECSISIKIDSTKRKFYRWFPDLDERFIRNSKTGYYEPKAGHVNEMAYRESMRISDQNKLVMKRLNGRSKVHAK